jgi:hypothetical protein
MVDRDAVFAACHRVARKSGVAAVTHRAVLKALGRGSFALGQHIEDWKKEQKRSGDIPPFLAEAAHRLVEELWRLVKDSMKIEKQNSRQLGPGKQTRSDDTSPSMRDSPPITRKEARRLAVDSAEETITMFNRPMQAVEIYNGLPRDIRDRIRKDKMLSILVKAKSSSRLIQLRDRFAVNDSRWWMAGLALPEEFLRRKKKIYKREETELALKRQSLDGLIEPTVEMLVESGEPLHFDVICQKLKVPNDVKKDFRRSLYRRSIYDERYNRIGHNIYQAK